MKSLIEIYDLQQQVKQNLNLENYQRIESLFAALQNQDLQQVLQIQFVFNPQLAGVDGILQQLHGWQRAIPQSFYPSVLMASFWHMIAATERGIQTMDRVSPAQHLRASAANDQFFYWALKALEFNPKSVTTYNALLEASGRLGMPDWLQLPLNQTINFSCLHYHQEAKEFITSFAGYEIPEGQINVVLSPPSAEEKGFTPLYWLNCILTIEPEHIASRKTLVRLLSPRWYGDENYENVTRFLASDYCANLSALQIKILQREKEYDQLTAYNTLPSLNFRKALEKRGKQFAERVNEHITVEEDALTRFEYIDFCYHVLTYMPDLSSELKDSLVKNIYQSLHHIVKSSPSWILFYRANEIFNILFSMMKIYEFDDELKIFDDLSRQTQYRNLTSPAEVLYRALAANFPLSVVSPGAESEAIEQYYIAGERNVDYPQFRLHIFILSLMGYSAAIKPVLEKFSSQYHAVNASILCCEIYSGDTPNLAKMLSVTKDSEKANTFLDVAVQRESSHAILIKSRQLETLIEDSRDPSEKSSLALEREALLKRNIQSGDALSQYDYACSLIASSDEKQVQKGLFIEAPKVLIDARIRLDQLAYIAYLYAFCAFNGRGMDKNFFVMDFWINLALQWDADPGYLTFLQKVREGAGLRPLYNWYVKRSKAKVSAEMMNIMEYINQ